MNFPFLFNIVNALGLEKRTKLRDESDYSTNSEDSSSAGTSYKSHNDYLVVKWPFHNF
ncbi:hypothetical protein NBO_2g0033 [Nosema bombycis CQ1]|uniref:Uncharacterized protein n=1 Tax=Nosema bombycis (strain CQ1 / CVCC 102059) TaxID=578461 RepID=R0KXB4_NOSB1|nr:hypothetical protein NBO_2g0033 [Nosema bombycis CQ1]|eukprot:EOB15541.1 hypothetical protein NBO_2g0033 [Nosema bombycis CQ1]